MFYRCRQKGVTLIELLLVIIIALTFVSLGIKVYQQQEYEVELQNVKSNVDFLFVAMKNYYLANCRAIRNSATGSVITSSTGQLDPTVNVPPVTSIVPININTALATPGYLEKWPLPYSVLVTNNYIVQFNLYNNSATYPNAVKTIYFCSNKNNCLAPTGIATKAVNNVYLWTIQVAVQVQNSAQAAYIAGRLNADCRSSLSGSVVTPCSQSPVLGSYLVFERLPSMASSTATTVSPLWLSIPGLKQFTEQYTNDNDYAVTNDDSAHGFPGYENYLCGG